MADRREFARVASRAGAAALLGRHAPPASAATGQAAAPVTGAPVPWSEVRAQFLLADGLGVMNAANLCPAPGVVVQALERRSRDVDRDPSFQNRAALAEAVEQTRRRVAAFLRVTPEEIVLVRNTSEANNLVSSGLELKAGDEVLLFSDNHPSNLTAWREKSRRFGFGIKVVDQVQPHPGPEFYVEAVRRQLTPRTRVLGFTHVTNTVGDLFPARELCRLARERGVLTLVDGAQTFGLQELDLSDMQPDFYSASGHKWACGPRETGVLYVRASAQPSLQPSVVSHHPGAVGASRTLEALGQRDEAALIALGEALAFQERIGRARIQAHARELAEALMEGLQRLPGVRLWTHPDAQRSLAVVTFVPASLDPQRLAAALYERDRIAGATRTGPDRPGLRFSPHLYNSHAEVERALSGLRRCLRAGV
jgi:selenocysteine lyase/cysteine desulfurase